jgi:S-adenosylmethionine hydrolase
MRQPVISLLTDFGSGNHYPGAMKGVMLGICPGVQMVDITHDITPFEIIEAAYTLAQAWTCFPAGTVHLVVVDPGVGSSRRAILAEADKHFFVAPDNGVLTMVLDSAPAHRVREISAARYFRKPVSQTFHGRDIFAPVAAHLAAGTPPAKFGKRIDNYLRLAVSKPTRTARRNWTGMILSIDRFGNIVTNFDWESFHWVNEQSFDIHVGLNYVSRYASAYAEVPAGELFVIRGSAEFLEISANQGDAAKMLGVAVGAPLEIRFL